MEKKHLSNDTRLGSWGSGYCSQGWHMTETQEEPHRIYFHGYRDEVFGNTCRSTEESDSNDEKDAYKECNTVLWYVRGYEQHFKFNIFNVMMIKVSQNQ